MAEENETRTKNGANARLVADGERKPARTPTWLRTLSAPLPGKLQLRPLLSDALFYPSCGRDGDPVRYLGGLVRSFVYVDSGIERDDVVASLESPRHRFRGYRVIGSRSVTAKELGIDPFEADLAITRGQNLREVGLSFFALWYVFARDEGYPPEHGPERFSWLYLCHDGLQAYRDLYVANRIAPKVIAVVQPGHGFGGSRWNFEDPQGELYRSVAENPAGMPEYLLHGAWTSEFPARCWPYYTQPVERWVACDARLCLWRRPRGM